MEDWQQRLDELARRHRVPGASLAVLQDGEVATYATGVVNVETGVETTPDSVFQIGSITKVFTATLIVQLVEEGRLSLDEPLAGALPELELAEPGATGQITVRHLLTHTSGIEGDHFLDTGRGDDALERYVASCRTLGLAHPVGATMSYCNTGFNIAGRIVERCTGGTWDRALQERIASPLGLRHTVTLADEALRFRAAFGHEVEPGREARLVEAWGLPRSAGPAGLICATASDVVRFAAAHLADGGALLPAARAAAMQEAQVEVPDPWTLGSHWGLGWILFDRDGRRLIGHDGNTRGQSAFLRVVPDAGVAVCLLTNGGHTADLYQDLFRGLLAETCGLTMPRPLEPPAEPVQVDVAPWTGTYERVGVRLELEDRQGALVARRTLSGLLATLTAEPTDELTLVPVAERVFVTRKEDVETWSPVVFYEPVEGQLYVHTGLRATPRVRPA